MEIITPTKTLKIYDSKKWRILELMSSSVFHELHDDFTRFLFLEHLRKSVQGIASMLVTDVWVSNFETKCVNDKFEMLLTDWKNRQHA